MTRRTAAKTSVSLWEGELPCSVTTRMGALGVAPLELVDRVMQRILLVDAADVKPYAVGGEGGLRPAAGAGAGLGGVGRRQEVDQVHAAGRGVQAPRVAVAVEHGLHALVLIHQGRQR